MGITSRPLFTLLLTSMVLAIPSSASGDIHLQMEGKELTGVVPEEFSGTVGFESLGGGVECEASIETTFEFFGAGGEVTEFDLLEESCEAFGALEECEVAAPIVAQNLPYELGVKDEATLIVTPIAGGEEGILITYPIEPGSEEACEFPNHIDLAFSELTLQVPSGQTEAIKEVAIDGEGTAFFKPGEFDLDAIMEGTLAAGFAGTYGIGD